MGRSGTPGLQRLNNLALLLAEKGANGEAEQLIRQAVAMWRETMGEGHPDVGDGLISLGRFLLDQDRCAEAEAPLRKGLAIREQTLDADAPGLASARLYLAECLMKLERRAEAKSLLAASLPVLVDHAVARVRPWVCFFGHHHTRLHAEIAGVRCIGLNKVAMPGNLVGLDVPARGRGYEMLGEWPRREDVPHQARCRRLGAPHRGRDGARRVHRSRRV